MIFVIQLNRSINLLKIYHLDMTILTWLTYIPVLDWWKLIIKSIEDVKASLCNLNPNKRNGWTDPRVTHYVMMIPLYSRSLARNVALIRILSVPLKITLITLKRSCLKTLLHRIFSFSLAGRLWFYLRDLGTKPRDRWRFRWLRCSTSNSDWKHLVNIGSRSIEGCHWCIQ